jgi:type I restriction enzyme, S subunit
MSSKGKSSAVVSGGADLVPKLRFPEFKAAPGWQYKRLALFLKDSSGRAPSNTTLPVFSSTREGLRRQDTYFDGRVLQNNNDYGVVPPGCFVYRHMSDDGSFKFNINHTGGKIAVSKEYPVFETVGLDSKFLLELLNEGEEFKRFAFSQKAGGTRTRLYFSKLREWHTLLPTLPEQQKIADCLDSADALIAAQWRKVEALKAHKKGLMQQLFPLDGETQPRLRFPEFEGAGEWGSKTVDETCETVNNRRRPIASNLRAAGPYPYYGASGIVDYIDDFIFDETLLLIGEDGAKWGAFERTAFLASGKYWVNNHAHVLRPVKAVDAFMANYLTMIDVSPHVTGAAPPKLTLGKLKEIRFPLPPTCDEQQRIADCLTSLDDLIAAETRKLATLKTHKKGLMQQLLPHVGEADA